MTQAVRQRCADANRVDVASGSPSMTRPCMACLRRHVMKDCLHYHLVETVLTPNPEHHEISDGAAAARRSGDVNAAMALFAPPLCLY